MVKVPVTDAAFEGFRLTRERPRAILAWAGLLLVLSVVTAFVSITLIGEDWPELRAAMANPPPAPEDAVQLLHQLAPVNAVLIPLNLLVFAMIQCAVARAVLQPGEGARGYLRLGVDEVRVLASLVLLLLVLALMLIVGSVLASLLSAAAGGGLVGFLLLVAVLGGLAWLFLRLSLAPVHAFVAKRIDLPGAWRLTRGSAWRLLGSYVLAFVLAFTVCLLGLAIFAAVAAVVTGGVAAAGAVFQPDYSSLSTYLNPAVLAGQVVVALVSALYHTLLLAPGVVAYRALSAPAEHAP